MDFESITLATRSQCPCARQESLGHSSGGSGPWFAAASPTILRYGIHSTSKRHIRGSIAVSISARHAEDPGSIPGRGEASLATMGSGGCADNNFARRYASRGTFEKKKRKPGAPGTGCLPISWPRGVTVSTLDSESSDRDSNPREAFPRKSLRFPRKSLRW